MSNLWYVTFLNAGLIVFLLVMGIYALFSLVAIISFAPYVHSGKKKIMTMLEIANLAAGDRILDLGSGNGDLCILAAQRGTTAIGLEINPLLVLWSRLKAKRRKVTSKASFVQADIWHYQFPNETGVVFVYGMPEKMNPLWKKMQVELRPGTVVVSHAFRFPQVTPEKEEGNVRLYRL